MIKKIFAALMITLVLAIGVFAVVKTTYAQDIVAQEDDDESVMEPQQETLEYEFSYQDGECWGDGEPIRNQTRLRELQDGECTGECDPQQLRLQEGPGAQGTMRQQRLNLGDGECTGECDPEQMRLNEGLGYRGMMQQNKLGTGDCLGDNVQMRQQGGRR